MPTKADTRGIIADLYQEELAAFLPPSFIAIFFNKTDLKTAIILDYVLIMFGNSITSTIRINVIWRNRPRYASLAAFFHAPSASSPHGYDLAILKRRSAKADNAAKARIAARLSTGGSGHLPSADRLLCSTLLYK